jgi:hypothetical protein
MEWTIDLEGDAVGELLESINRGRMVRPGLRSLNEQTIARYHNVKIQVFSDEHPPPHFRVEAGGETANFTIKDCAKLNGKLDAYRYNIQDWHAKHKQLLIDKWNSSRPTGCPVGLYKE